MPHHIIAMWVEFGQFPLNDASFAFRIISHCLAYGNSCVNPILYAFLSENFRKACKQVFTCRFFYSPPPVEKVVRIRMENFSTTHSTTNIWFREETLYQCLDITRREEIVLLFLLHVIYFIQGLTNKDSLNFLDAESPINLSKTFASKMSLVFDSRLLFISLFMYIFNVCLRFFGNN